MAASDRRKPQRGAATTREQAMRLLAEGITVAEVARRLSLHRRTVEKWRTTTDGAEVLAAAKVEVEQKFSSSLEAARAKLTDALFDMADKVILIAKEGEHADALRAIGMAMDRVGLPRTERIETPSTPMDTSKLSTEELEQLAVLLAKAGHR